MEEVAVDSVALLLHRLKEGDSQAPDGIWSKYFTNLVEHARNRLRSLPNRVTDEEDVALSALNSFFEGAKRQRFPELKSRDDLWKLLLVITARKATAARRKAHAAKRPDAHFVNTSQGRDEEDADWLQQAIGAEPTPEAIVMFSDELQRLLQLLPNDEVRQIASWKLEGLTNLEIAVKLNTYEEKVRRKLEVIRSLWKWDDADA
jgi:DNA-directed RNA polymerase specialized sigma24 family protein